MGLKGEISCGIIQQKSSRLIVLGCFAMFHTKGMLRVALCQQLGLKANKNPRFHRFGAILVKSLQLTHQLPASVSWALWDVCGTAPSKDTSPRGQDHDKYRCDFKPEQLQPAGISAGGGLLQRGFLEKLGTGWEFTVPNPNGVD